MEASVTTQLGEIENALKNLLTEVQRIKDSLHKDSDTRGASVIQNSPEQDDSLLRI